MSGQSAHQILDSSHVSFDDHPPLRLAGLRHGSDITELWEGTLPRLTTFSALQGLWRPTMGSTGNGLLVVIPAPPDKDSDTICGFTIGPSSAIGAPLMGFSTPAGLQVSCTVTGPWSEAERAYHLLCEHWMEAHGMRQHGPWFTLFRTNPRSTAPKDWTCDVRIPIVAIGGDTRPPHPSDADITATAPDTDTDPDDGV